MPRSSNPSLEWAKGIEDKESFLELVKADYRILGQLRNLIDDMLNEIQRQEVDADVYLSPGYHDWQAHMNGRKAGLLQVRTLLNFLED